MATPVHQEKRKHQAARSPKIESKDDQPIRENLEKNSVKNLSVKQIKEICDKNLQVCLVNIFIYYKLRCVFPKVVVSILPHAEFGRHDHRGDAPHFIYQTFLFIIN